MADSPTFHLQVPAPCTTTSSPVSPALQAVGHLELDGGASNRLCMDWCAAKVLMVAALCGPPSPLQYVLAHSQPSPLMHVTAVISTAHLQAWPTSARRHLQPVPWPACGPLNSHVVLSCTRAAQHRKLPEHTWGQRGRPQTCLPPVCFAPAAFGWVHCILPPALRCTDLFCSVCLAALFAPQSCLSCRHCRAQCLLSQRVCHVTPSLHVFSPT